VKSWMKAMPIRMAAPVYLAVAFVHFVHAPAYAQIDRMPFGFDEGGGGGGIGALLIGGIVLFGIWIAWHGITQWIERLYQSTDGYKNKVAKEEAAREAWRRAEAESWTYEEAVAVVQRPEYLGELIEIWNRERAKYGFPPIKKPEDAKPK